MTSLPSFLEFKTRELASAATAYLAAAALVQGIGVRGSASLAVSGGRSPGRTMEILSGALLDWQHISVGLVDERFVAPHEDGSNEALAREKLMGGPAASATFVPMYQHNETPDNAASIANSVYETIAPFDFALLGMGGDGHTASWFPKTQDLQRALTSDELVIAVDSENVPGARNWRHRLTLTRYALSKTRSAVMLLFGEERRDTFEQSLEMDVTERPVRGAVDALGARLIVVWAP